VTRGNTITITATLLQNASYGDPVPDQKIYFFDQTYDTLLGSDETDTNGIASIEWSIPISHTLGLTTINATFYGNDSLSLAPSAQWTIITVLSSTDIEINHAPTELAPGDSLSFSVQLTDDTSGSIADATVLVFKDSILLAMNTTDSSGETLFEIECNSSWITLGNNDIRVVYNQDLDNYLDSSESVFTVSISRIPTTVTPQGLYPNEVILNESLELYVELSESNGSLPNELLEFTLDDQPLLYATSNSSGIAYFHINIDDRFTLGSHTLRINYNGTIRYSESFFETPLVVSSPVLLEVSAPDSAEIGKIVEIQISVSDLLGRLIPNSQISILDTATGQRFSIASSQTVPITIFQYELLGPAGIHALNIEIIENPFISNNTFTSTITAWSHPEISLVTCNVENYASPGQEIAFEIHMNDWAGNCSFRELHLYIDDENSLSVLTNIHGLATLSLPAPYLEGQYNISIVYSGNNTIFELASKLDYNLHVLYQMPIRLELDSYEIVTPLHELSVHMTVIALNGSKPTGIVVNFDWLDSIISAESSEEGVINLHLRIPATNGNHILFYESKASESVQSTSGSFLIEISLSDIMSLEGVGIIGLTIALIASVGISIVPIIRQKYLVG